MKKFKFVALVAAVMIVTLLSVSGVWAGSLQQDTETSGTATGANAQVITGAALQTLLAENPAPAGQTVGGVVSQVGAGQVCFVKTWAQIAAGDLQNPHFAALNVDSNSWSSAGITTELTGIAADGSGLQYCASVGGGTYAFLGY